MSKKKINFTVEFKTKVVLEVLKNEQSIGEIATKYNIIPRNITNWKKQFLENASLAFDKSNVVKEYKNEIEELKSKNDEYAKVVGKMTVERDWLSGKLNSLDLSIKKTLVESKLETISITRQCELLNINRSSLYYEPIINEKEKNIKEHIVKIHEEIPIYGYLKVHQQLLEDGFDVSPNTVHKYRQELGLRAILAVKKPNTSLGNQQHPIYSYKLKDIDITQANQVWSTDITYIPINGGFVYLAAIIDWYSKAVLSWRISNVMDTDLVMSVLDDALRAYGKPKIFNTDQGSQYTSFIHTQTLKNNGIEISMDDENREAKANFFAFVGSEPKALCFSIAEGGRATDNICIERFSHRECNAQGRSAKCEKIYLNEYNSMAELKNDVKDYIDFYNYRRFHESLDYKKPMNVYLESMKINDENYKNLVEFVA